MIKKIGIVSALALGAGAVLSLGACGSTSGSTHTARPAATHASTSAPALPDASTQRVAVDGSSAKYDPDKYSIGKRIPTYAVNLTWTNRSAQVVTDAAVIGEYDAAGHLVMKTTAYGALLEPGKTWHDNGTLLEAPKTDSVRSFKVLSVAVHGRKWVAPGGTK